MPRDEPAAQPSGTRLPFVWDYDIDEAAFRRLLEGRTTLGRLDRDWAAVRLLEYGSYADVVRLAYRRGLSRKSG